VYVLLFWHFCWKQFIFTCCCIVIRYKRSWNNLADFLGDFLYILLKFKLEKQLRAMGGGGRAALDLVVNEPKKTGACSARTLIRMYWNKDSQFWRIFLSAINGPMIYTAPYVMLSMRATPLRGKVGGGCALETEIFWALWNFIKPSGECMPFGAQKKAEIFRAHPPTTCRSNGFARIRSIPYRVVSISQSEVHGNCFLCNLISAFYVRCIVFCVLYTVFCSVCCEFYVHEFQVPPPSNG
jgi:hypothetical protein